MAEPNWFPWNGFLRHSPRSLALTTGYILRADCSGILVQHSESGTAHRHLLGRGALCRRAGVLESTVTAEMVSPDTLAISYGVLGIVTGGTRFLSSAVIGALWTAVSPVVGFGLASGLMVFDSIALRRLGR